jgi:hypothetical protein
VDVVAAVADLVEGGRLHAVLLGRPARDRVQPDVRDLAAFVRPDVAAVVLPDDARRDVDVLGREAALEHVGRLDGMVVHAHQDHVVETHALPLVRD